MATLPRPVVLQRSSIVSGPETARADLRKASNCAKRMADLTVACVMRGGTQPDFLRFKEALEDLTDETLQRSGYLEHASEGFARAMVSEALASHIRAFIEQHPSDDLAQVHFDLMARRHLFVEHMNYVLLDQKAEQLLQIQWPEDTTGAADATVLLVANMTPVVQAASAFSFGLAPSQAAGMAARFVSALALRAVDEIAPEAATADSRMFHYQTLLKSACSLYAAAWQRVSMPLVRALESLPIEDRQSRGHLVFQLHEQQAYLLQVERQVASAFSEVVRAALELTRPDLPIAEFDKVVGRICKVSSLPSSGPLYKKLTQDFDRPEVLDSEAEARERPGASAASLQQELTQSDRVFNKLAEKAPLTRVPYSSAASPSEPAAPRRFVYRGGAVPATPNSAPRSPRPPAVDTRPYGSAYVKRNSSSAHEVAPPSTKPSVDTEGQVTPDEQRSTQTKHQQRSGYGQAFKKPHGF